MPDFCTCGAELPSDALFCHKCGKPQRDIQAVEPEVEPALESALPPPRVEPAVLAVPGFRNATAVRISAVVALVATFFVFLPFFNWLAGGFFAVFFYRRKTSERVTLRAGMQLGWMTGLMMFALLACLVTGTLLLINAMGGITAVEAQLKQAVDPRVAAALEAFRNRTNVLTALAQQFVMVNFLSMIGGLLCATMPVPPANRFRQGRGGGKTV